MNFKKKLIVLLVSPLLISCNSFLTLFKKVNDTTETNVETSKPTETLNEKIEQTQDETIDFFNLATTRFSVSDAYALGIGENNSLKTRAPEDPRPLEFLKQKVQSFTGIVPELDISSVAITETKNSDTLNAYNFSCIAKRKKDDLNVIEDLIFTENTIEVKVDSMHSFRIVNNEFSEDSGWIKGSGDYISYQVSNEGKEHINQYKVYVRSDDAFIKFDDADGLTYTIKDSNGNILFEDLKDNDEADADPSEGMIIVEGLTEDETYQIQKSGYIEIEEISTENLDFGIEHVYVYNTQYSFVTFVGMGQSCRGGGEEGVFTDVTGADERDCGFYNYKGQTLTYVLENTTGRLLPIKYEGKVRIRNRIIQDASSLMVLDLCIFDDYVSFVSIGYKAVQYPDNPGAMDKYGNHLLFNYQVPVYDKEKKAISEEDNYAYFYSQEGEIFRQKKIRNDGDIVIYPIEKLNEELEFVPLNITDNASNIRYIRRYDYIFRDCLPYEIINGKTYFAPISSNRFLPDHTGGYLQVKPKYLYAEMEAGESTPSLLCEFNITDEEREQYLFNFNALAKYDLVLCQNETKVYEIRNLKKYLKNGGSSKPIDFLNDSETIELRIFEFESIDSLGKYQFHDGDVIKTVQPFLVSDGETAHYEMIETDSWGKTIDTVAFQHTK